MDGIGIIGLLLLLVNAYASYKGLKDHFFLEMYSFQVDKILIEKDYKRLVSSGFLHVSWTHFFFNMISLYFFSGAIENKLGAMNFIFIYFGSLVGGNLFSLFIHRNHSDYSAVGASGAISGIVFAAIALFPGMSLGFFFLPISIPGWAYGLLYVLYSIYGIRSQRDNIGHDAHLGGGLIGLLIAVIMVPESIKSNTLPIILILLPSAIFIYLIVTRPEFLLVDNLFQKRRNYYTIEDKYYTEKHEKEKELNMLLDKINEKGISSLTDKEREKLKTLSK